MDYQVVRSLEFIAYALIEAMGKQAENKIREHRGEAMAYDEDAFIALAENMRRMVLTVLQQ